MNTSINIQRPTTPTSSQSVIIIPDSPQSATPQTQSVTPQSEGPQARSVSRKTQTSSVSHQTQTGPQLSDAAARAVDPSLDLREHAVDIRRTPVSRANLRRLLNGQKSKDMYLDDEVIDFYFARLRERCQRNPTLPKIHCYSTQFYKSVNRENWACKITVFDKDIVLIPVLINSNHWVLVAFFPLIKTVIYYDSRHNDGKTVRDDVLNFFKTRFTKETGSSSTDFEWKSTDEPDVPDQSNSYDCGVFVCQMAERLSRRSPFNFNQSQMPAIRIQMIEQIVAGEILLPPSDPVGPPPQRPNRFDQPPSKQILRLEEELRALRTKFAEKESELEEVKKASGNLLEETIKEIQNKANDVIHRLETELTTANRNLEVMAVVCQNIQKRKNERIDRMEADHKQQMDNLKQDADQVLNKRLNALQADNEEEIQMLLTERQELRSKLSRPLVTESVTQTDEFPPPNPTTLADDDTQTEKERPDTTPPMLAEFPFDTEEPFTRPKTPQSEDSASDNSDPDYNQPPSKQRKLSTSENFEPLSETENDELPVCPSAQVPPPLPVPIVFGDTVVVKGRVKKGDNNVSIHRPNQVVNLPLVQEPGADFDLWLHTHGINSDHERVTLLTRDLELRRRFLVQGDLSPEEQQFIVDRVPPAYDIHSVYLRSLAGYALSQYDSEQAFALLYCFSRLSSKALRNVIQRL